MVTPYDPGKIANRPKGPIDPPDRAGRPGPRGRGAGFNPANRFEPLRYEADEEDELSGETTPSPETLFLRDPSRSVVAFNESPDVGFAASLNPYRGCEHGCVYCLAPETPVLHADLAWRPLGEVRVGDSLVGFDEVPLAGRARKLRPAVVEAVWWSRKPTLRLVTQRADVVTTAEHRWLRARDFRWSRTEQLAPGRRLRWMTAPPSEEEDADYRAGYLAGLTLGGGTFRYGTGWRSDKRGFPQACWRIALIDREPLARSVAFLASFGVEAQMRRFSPGRSTRTPMWKVETRSLGKLEIIDKIVQVERSSRSYRRGFVAGFFDAEGYNGSSLRISQVDVGVLERVRSYARSLGFVFALEPRPGRASTVRLVGSIAERLRFFSVFRPAIRRKREALFGRTPVCEPDPVEAVESGPMRDVVDIQTSTRTFYAAGLATHNCYARPTHEYLGFSAGLDFETRILVKPEAPALLRRTLSARSWKPQVLALSGVTDPYQPIERRLRITRGCLEVLAELRNPVFVITKNRLVARDGDLLAELTRFGAAAVAVSVTTLDPELHRVMEPRTSRPELRLEAIARLAEAGIPTGVMVAPVIPALNEPEIPAILEAAARAGASFAGRVLLRLPHAVAPLFEDWLARHFPERKAKVLNRIRALRGGRLNDPRFGSRMRGSGIFADSIQALFELGCRRAEIAPSAPELSADAFRPPQLRLFD